MTDQTHSRVVMRRTGGFGGIEVCGQLSGDQLSPADVQLLRSLIEQRGEDPLIEQSGPPPVPDVMRYELLVQVGGQPHELVFTDIDLPPALRPLIQRLITAR